MIVIVSTINQVDVRWFLRNSYAEIRLVQFCSCFSEYPLLSKQVLDLRAPFPGRQY